VRTLFWGRKIKNKNKIARAPYLAFQILKNKNKNTRARTLYLEAKKA